MGSGNDAVQVLEIFLQRPIAPFDANGVEPSINDALDAIRDVGEHAHAEDTNGITVSVNDLIAASREWSCRQKVGPCRCRRGGNQCGYCYQTCEMNADQNTLM